MRTADEWTRRPLGRNAALVLAWRRGSRIKAGRLNLAREMNQELRQRAHAALSEIGQRTVRAYDPAAYLEDDEVFLLTVDELPTRPQRHRPGRQPTAPDDGTDQQAEASELVGLLRTPGDLDPIAADTARGQTFLFYAAVFSSQGSSIAFVKRHNPAAVVKTGRVLGLFGDVVTRIEQPVLVFEPDFDLVVEGDELAALKPTALSRIFVDLEVAAAAVPAHIAGLRASALRFADSSLDVIALACTKRRLLAGRLQGLIQAKHLETLTVDSVRNYLTGLDEDPARFISSDQIVVAEEDVAALLDVLDQRHYRSGYDYLLRRADRNSVIS
jgi:hypothetical protein